MSVRRKNLGRQPAKRREAIWSVRLRGMEFGRSVQLPESITDKLFEAGVVEDAFTFDD